MDRRTFLAVVASALADCVSAPDERASAHRSEDREIEPPAGATQEDATTAVDTGTTTNHARTTGATDGPTVDDSGPSVGLEPLVEGLDAPVTTVVSPDAPSRRYVAERDGVVVVSEPDGGDSEPLLDLRDRVVTGGERGLLGLALHPSFEDTRRLFVRYSAPPREGTPEAYSHTFVLAEFAVGPDGREVDLGSERSVLEIPQPGQTHNAGDIAFGPDGYLYVPVGDGGGAGDDGLGHVDDWYDAVPGGNGQDVTENLLGSVLRIDVDDEDGDRPYGIPDDNPLVGEAGLDEHYAWGFRNPWRLSFDGEDLYVGDVGQSRYEEIDRVEKGGNYGWNVKEGTHCYGVEEVDVDSCPDATPDDVRGGEPLLNPVIEYPNWKHARSPVSGAAVVCGYKYHGSAVPGLNGRFVLADWVARGRLFVATPAANGLWPTDVVAVAEGDRDRMYTVTSFGRDPSGELTVVTTGEDGTGGVYRLVAGV